ncbi:MAG: hypothetical protein MR809_04330 [Rikenellaceae bacterium]|nr:hypothetical protein [Rikenellaceae bacterium]
MKRNAIIMLAISSILVSCSKDAVQDSTPGKEDEVYEGDVEMTFSAVADPTKTSIGELVDGQRKISWEKDDEIAILFSDQVTTSQAKSAGESTEFDARVDQAEHYYAVYPSSAGSLNGNELTVTIPSTQTISSGFGSAHYAAAVAVNNNFAFKNLCGWIKFTVPEGSEVKRILVRGNGEQPITGKITVTFDENGNIATSKVSGGNSRLIVDIDGPGEYYAAVLPGMDLANGVGFRFYTDHSTASEKAISPGVFNSEPLEVQMGAIKNLGDLTARIVKDWYIAPGGTGDGTSADHPADGVSFLRKKLAQDQTSDATKNGLAKGYGCIGVTIHAAAGEYDFAGEEILMAWPGHTSLIRTSIEGEDGTVFTNTGESRFFSIGKNVNLKLTGIKVQNGNASGSTGGAVYVSDASALLELESCVFESNSADTGGALYVAGGLIANATDFISNSATTAAGAVGLTGSGTVSFTACNFRNNQAGRHAGAIQNYGGSGMKLNITGGEFIENSTTETAGGGGALSFRGSGTETVIDGVKLSANTAGKEGGAMRIYADNAVVVKNTEILSNKAVNGGGIFVNAGNVDFGGVLKGNIATDKGAAIYVSGKSVTRLNNAIITENQSKTYAAGICVNSSADVWLNNCSIFANSSTTASTSTAWGVAIFVASAASDTNICINNTTIADQSVQVTGSDTNVDLQGGSLVFANSTMIATSAAGLLRIHSSAKDGCFLNSIVINKKADLDKQTGKSINFNSKGTLTSKYVISGIPQNSYKATEEIDKANVTYANLGSPALDETDHLYKWNGSLDGCPVAPVYSTVSELIQTAHSDFYNWLVKLEALDKDALGNSRSNNRQGAYCGN